VVAAIADVIKAKIKFRVIIASRNQLGWWMPPLKN
jgi:hypothetical protein